MHTEYIDLHSIKLRNSVDNKKKVERWTERFNKSRQGIKAAQAWEAMDEREAFKVYQEMRATRKYDSNRDVLLYHYDSKVISCRSKK